MKKKLVFDKSLLAKQLFFVLTDSLTAIAASALALFLRFDFSIDKIPYEYLELVLEYAIPNVLTVCIVYWFCKLYRSIWLYAGLYEFMNIVLGGCIATVLHLVELMLISGERLPRSYWFLYLGFLICLTTVFRFTYRFLREMQKRFSSHEDAKIKRVMIVGAGDAADMLIREMTSANYLNMQPVCLIDDDPKLLHRTHRGIKIVGNSNDIIDAARQYEINQIIIAMPSVSKKRISEIASICNKTKCEIKTLPGLYQLVNSEVSVSKLRPVNIEDLLGREPVKIDKTRLYDFVSGKVVLVTGGGGSIGSELCRQIAAVAPKMLIIVDIYENNAYDIQQELLMKYRSLNLVVLIASVRNLERMRSIFAQYHPEVVFHAAAHKHVPLMETSPNEAIKNNVFGTLNVAKCADEFGTGRFVLISTDKAVNPTNVMGASKRMCEMIVQAYSRKSRTKFVAVRFGNVLGSNGSVIPLFKKQILAGGPVTVTHPEINRFFMTIPEAVSLVLEAGAFADGGEIYVLDMGEPVKIADLAENLIRLSGFTPGEDIEIQYTGLRPGEKLYEERLMDEEGLSSTENNLISVAKPIPMDDAVLFEKLDKIYDEVYKETGDVRTLISEMVPTYKPASEQQIRQN